MVDKKIRLNKEQLAAVKHGRGPLLIIAGAGTGKTTVITERIKHLIFSKLAKPDEILALTFTNKAAREMEERVDIAMPYGYTQMWISTFHSFCDRVLKQEALHIGLDPKYRLLNQAGAVQLVRKNLFKFDLNYFLSLGNPDKFIVGMLQHFSRLQDEDVTPAEYVKWVKTQKGKSKEERLEIKKWKELAKAYKVYEELKVKEGALDFGDLIAKTLKLYRDRPNVLKEYQKRFKYILVDEFQDTNIAQNELAILLAGKTKNIAVVGDDDQCLPSNAMVDIPKGRKAVRHIRIGDEVVTAVGKGYLSTSKVLYVNKTKKKDRFLTFITESGKRLEVTDNHKMFCMVPGRDRGSTSIYVYLMKREGMGWRLGITSDLAQRLKLERSADKIIAVKSCNSIEEARFLESILSMRFQIPTYPFKPRKRMKLTGKWLDKLYSEFNTEQNSRKLADSLGISLNAHQYCLDGVVRGGKERIKIILNMCIRRHRTKWAKDRLLISPKVMHVVSMHTSSRRIKRILEKNKIKFSRAKNVWRVRKYYTDITEAGKFAKKLERLTGGILEPRFDIGKKSGYTRSALVIPASNILEGMFISVRMGHEVIYERVKKRIEKEKTRTVYDLEIERTHNFIADGVVVHNSIYRFRGSSVSNIVQFKKHIPKTKVVTLITNYRSSQEILDKAYNLIQHNNPDRLEVVENVNKKLVAQKKGIDTEISFLHLDRVENEADVVAKKIDELVQTEKCEFKDFAILVRANNHAEPFSRALSRHGIPYQFLGPGRLFKQPEVADLISYLKVLDNFEDSVSLYRFLSIDYFEIKPRDLAAIGNLARRRNLSLFEICESINEVRVSEQTKKKIKKVIQIIKRHFKLVRRETAGQILYYFLEDTGLMQYLLNPKDIDAEKKAVNISKFFDKLKTYEVDHKDATIPAVVDWIELASELGESPLAADTDWTDINAVSILTVHSSKGLEFPAVFLVNLVSLRFPSMHRREQIPIPEKLIKEILPIGDYHIQEERRLFYVGMTRAMDRVFLTAANYYGEGKREKKLSPFIFEALGDEAIASERPMVDNNQLTFLDYTKPKIQRVKPDMPKLHVDYLSYSQIQTFKICPLHYKLKYILKVPTPKSPAQSFGTSIHASLDDFYKAHVAGERATIKTLMNIFSKEWVNEGYLSKAHEKRAFEKGKRILEEFYKQEFDRKTKPIGLETMFKIPLNPRTSPIRNDRPLIIGGMMDRIDRAGRGIEIIDYKTGDRVPSQKETDRDNQLTIYALAAKRIQNPPFGKEPEKVKMTLNFLEKGESITTTRTRKQLREAEKEVFKIRNEIEKSDFSCSGHIFCKKCEYKLMCGID